MEQDTSPSNFVKKLEPRMIVCDKCGEFVNEASYNFHIFNVHKKEKKVHSCEICGKVFTSSYNLKYHIAHHLNLRNYVCSECPNAYNTVSDLAQHRRVHVKQKNPTQKNFSGLYSEVNKEYHPDVKKGRKKNEENTKKIPKKRIRLDPGECEECGQFFKHIKRHNDVVHLKIRNHECAICHKKFYKKSACTRHFEMVHKTEKDHICDLCGKGFTEKSLLSKHKAKHETGPLQTSYFCSVCSQHVSNIKNHFESVHMDLQFGCEKCHRRFSTQKELDKHVDSRHTKKLTCDLCGKGFTMKYFINRHMLSHLNQAERLRNKGMKRTHKNLLVEVFEAHNEDSFDNFQDESESDEHDRLESTEIVDFVKAEKSDQDFFNDSVVISNVQIKKEPEENFANILIPIIPEVQIDVKSEQGSEAENANDNLMDDLDDKVIEAEKPTRRKRGRPPKLLKEVQEYEENIFDEDLPLENDEKITNRRERRHGRAKKFVNLDKSENGDICDEFSAESYGEDDDKPLKRSKLDRPKKLSKKDPNRPKKTNEKVISIKENGVEVAVLCPICHERFKYRQAMYRHKLVAHNIGIRHKCDKCPRDFETKSRLRMHINTHHNPNREGSLNNMCPYCSICFHSRNVLNEHKRLTHGVNDEDYLSTECQYCKEKLRRFDTRRRHIVQVHLNGKKLTRSCNYCQLEFTLYDEYKAHCDSHVGIFICMICGMFYFDEESLKAHKISHKVLDFDLRRYCCDLCGHRIDSKQNLIMHMDKHKKDAQQHYCDICGKGFKCASTLYTHQKYHGEGKHQCSYCGRKFARNTDLIVHVRIHTQEKPFRCTICDRGFVSKPQLKLHQQTHPETKVPYKCKLCRSQFEERKELVSHEEQVHPETRPFRCFICEISYQHEWQLTKHNLHKHSI